MFNFAKSQLLKYGWTEGKGLGKNENGITEALKPKLKFDTCGVGYKDVDFQWWEFVYNNALKNIILYEKSDEVLINIKEKEAFNISSIKTDIELSKQKQLLYYGKFLKTSTLQDENMKKDNFSPEVLEKNLKNDPIFEAMTDEDLFKACEGRTIHKSARHGLTLNGKLGRIAKQEKQLLAATFLKSNIRDSYTDKIKYKKNKKKLIKVEHCTLEFKNKDILNYNESSILPVLVHTSNHNNFSKKVSKKVKRRIHNLSHQLTKSCTIQNESIAIEEKLNNVKTKNVKEISTDKTKSKKKTSKRKRDQLIIDSHINNHQFHNEEFIKTHIKKSKKNYNSSEIISTLNTSYNVLNNIKKKNYVEPLNNRFKCTQFSHCTNTEAQRLNAKIKSKKNRKLKKKERKTLEKLSKSLLAVNLSVNSLEENIDIFSSNKNLCKKMK